MKKGAHRLVQIPPARVPWLGKLPANPLLGNCKPSRCSLQKAFEGPLQTFYLHLTKLPEIPYSPSARSTPLLAGASPAQWTPTFTAQKQCWWHQATSPDLHTVFPLGRQPHMSPRGCLLCSTKGIPVDFRCPNTSSKWGHLRPYCARDESCRPSLLGFSCC